ncbi:MAG: TIGR01459 family HAD-type hydrolase [Sphingomicrobium sp.]
MLSLDSCYRLILCDIWGVVHDGGQLLPGAAECLSRLKREGRSIVLVTNAPRPAQTVRAQIDALGLPRACYDAITSSGEAGIAALTDPPRAVGFLGTAEDRAVVEANGVTIVDHGFDELACLGLDEARDEPADYAPQLKALAASGVLMHCLNPDRVVIHRARREPCAGALADIYEQLGGRVTWYGKPYAAIYDHARALAGNPPREAILAIGDSLATDMLGAARYGIDAVYVASGIHAGEPIPADFAARNGLGDWQPFKTIAGLG